MKVKNRRIRRRRTAPKETALIVLAAFLASAMLLACAMPAWGGWQQETCAYLRPDAVRESAEETEAERPKRPSPDGSAAFWEVGDVLVRELDGGHYSFRCIDQNYVDEQENHRQGALFLCDTVIPADYRSDYVFGELADGSHGYRFEAGPIVSFGDGNDYKYSRIRAWLRESEEAFSDALAVHTGVSRAYTGSTAAGAYGGTGAAGLTAAGIGSQQMTDRLFVLSVDEAVKYRGWLWKFEGSGEDNPQTQVDAFCKGYWLRSPMGDASGADSGCVYVVDLVQGNLRPCAVAPERRADGENAVAPGSGADGENVVVPGSEGGAGGAGASGDSDVELAVTTVIGVRPAFVLPQAE